MSSPLRTIDSRVVGEVEMPTREQADLALIGADMDIDFDYVKVQSVAVIGRFTAPDGPGYLAGCCIKRMQTIDLLEKRMIDEMNKTKDPRLVVAISEGVKNVGNLFVAVAGVHAKTLEMMAYGGKKRSRQSNAPQAFILGANPQIVVQANGVAPSESEP